jgi:hypothetical protein
MPLSQAKTGVTSISPNSRKVFLRRFSVVLFLTRIIDGVTYPGVVKEKAEAQKQYSAAVGRGESAGIVK